MVECYYICLTKVYRLCVQFRCRKIGCAFSFNAVSMQFLGLATKYVVGVCSVFLLQKMDVCQKQPLIYVLFPFRKQRWLPGQLG